MKKQLRIAVIVSVEAAFLSALIYVLPLLGVPFLAREGRLTFKYSTPVVGGGDDIEPEFEEENPMVFLEVPTEMKESSTAAVSAQLREKIPSIGLMRGQQPRHLEYSASLGSPSFDITPTEEAIKKAGEGMVEWEWLVLPKRTGAHKIRLEFGQHVISRRSIEKLVEENRMSPGVVISESALVVPVVVLTPLGLTAAQDAGLKAFGGLIALIVSILALPFLKRYADDGGLGVPAPKPPPARVTGSEVSANGVEGSRVNAERLERVHREYLRSGTPKPMIDTFTDLTRDEQAELFEKVVMLKKGRPPKQNPYRKEPMQDSLS